MKRIPLVILSLLLAPPLFANAGQRLIPAGSLVSCTTGDARISSQTTAVGDPVLCKVEHRRGDFMLPYGSYLGGEFEEYRDPGHFFGKGWMELSFDRLYVGDTVVPVDAKVVDVPGYKIDAQGRILGKGHAVRDTITWMIPVLWPIDLINLPRRGPRPTLKAETAVTLRVMEDIQVPDVPEPQTDPYGLIPRRSQSYAPESAPPSPPPSDDQQPAEMSYAPPIYEPVAPPVAYEPVAPPPIYYAPAPMSYFVAPPPMVAYGGMIAPQVSAYAYASRAYAARPLYGARFNAPVYGNGYGYAARPGVSAGFAARSSMMAARGGYRR